MDFAVLIVDLFLALLVFVVFEPFFSPSFVKGYQKFRQDSFNKRLQRSYFLVSKK